MDNDALALFELAGHRDEVPEPHDGHRDVLGVVAQCDVARRTAPHVDFDNLAFDPRRRPAFDGIMVFLADHADRPRVLRGGVAGEPRQLVEWLGRVGVAGGCHGIAIAVIRFLIPVLHMPSLRAVGVACRLRAWRDCPTRPPSADVA